MKRILVIGSIAAVILMMLALGTMPASANHGQPHGQAGTTLSAEKSAEGFWIRTITYEWSLVKSADPASLTIPNGEYGVVNYTLTAERALASDTTVAGVSGQICVENGGERATEGLAIVDVVQKKPQAGEQYADFASSAVDVSGKPVLEPGERACYPYTVNFEPEEGMLYRNTARVTITNHSGHLGEPWGPGVTGGTQEGVKADFAMPAEPELVIIDAEADVSDAMSCPDGFTCSGGLGEWHLGDSGETGYAVRLTNYSACDTSFELVNNAKLTTSTTGTEVHAAAAVLITVPPCPTGCTRTIGYWKNHAGFGPQADKLSPLLPVWLGSTEVSSAAYAVEILNRQGDSSNGLNKLMAQLLAAKLNMANGADGGAIYGTVIAADGALALNWDTMTKKQRQDVLRLMSTLDAYNNGAIGPGHCP